MVQVKPAQLDQKATNRRTEDKHKQNQTRYCEDSHQLQARLAETGHHTMSSAMR